MHRTCSVGLDQKIYIDSELPKSPQVDNVSTVAKEIPITPPTDSDVNKIEVTFPERTEPVTLIKGNDDIWLIDNTPIKIENGKVLVPVPTDVKLKPDDKITAVAYDKAGNISETPGEGVVKNELPIVDASDVKLVRGEKHFGSNEEKLYYLKSLATVTDKEDDIDTTDNKVTKFEVISDGGFNPNEIGNYAITVKAIDGDGKETIKTFTITVIPTEADENSPSYEETETKPGHPVKVPQVGDKELPSGTTFSVEPKDVPEGWEVNVDPNTGEVTITPNASATPGTEVEIPVKVTYPDGTEETTPAKVTVIPTEADENSPSYKGAETKPGHPVKVPQVGDKELPSGTTFSVEPKDVPEGWEVSVDPNTGEVTATPGKEIAPGTKAEVPVKVTYPDGTEETTPAKVAVIPTEADENSPSYEGAETKPGQPVKTSLVGNKDEKIVSHTKITNDVSSNQLKNIEKAKNKKTVKNLPDTGEEVENSSTLLGGLFTGLGLISLFRKRRNQKSE